MVRVIPIFRFPFMIISFWIISRFSARATPAGRRYRRAKWTITNSPPRTIANAPPVVRFLNLVLLDANKEFDAAVQVGFGQDGEGGDTAADFAAAMTGRGLAPIFLLSPTTPESRVESVARLARGYVYYVSLKGVTGAGHLDPAEVGRKLAEIRRHVALPVGVGFGIRDAVSAQAVAAHADAVVIGSRIIQEIEAGPAADAASRAGAWLGTIRHALDAMPGKPAR